MKTISKNVTVKRSEKESRTEQMKNNVQGKHSNITIINSWELCKWRNRSRRECWVTRASLCCIPWMNPKTYWKPNHRKKAQNMMNHFIDSSETFFSFLLYIFFSSLKLGFTFEWINNVINGNLKTEFSHIFQVRNLPLDADVAMRHRNRFSCVSKFKFL